uniref:Amidase domain-containing protein n=1 Tax=Acrobeloides nanus TaxID=290746 RepID=A0A914EM66_9BILA
MPTAPTVAPFRTASTEELKHYRTETVKLLSLASLSGFPQITLPLGKVHGAQYGISILGKPYTDELLIQLAKMVLKLEK